MSVEFEENNIPLVKHNTSPKDNFSLSIFFIKKGIVKDIKQYNTILTSVCVFFVIITAIIFYFTFKSPSHSNTAGVNSSVIKKYVSQGIRGKDLIKRLKQDRASGLIK